MQATVTQQAHSEACFPVQHEEAVESAVQELEMQVNLRVRLWLSCTSVQ